MYKKNLLIVIRYLQGDIDIYDGNHNIILNTWNQAWDEIKWAGYNPATAEGIKSYIKEQL